MAAPAIDPRLTDPTMKNLQPQDTAAQPINLGSGIPTPNQGGGLLDDSGQALLNSELARASAGIGGNDMQQLMQGVGADGSQGLLKDTGGSTSLGGVGGDSADFESALSQRGKDAVAGTVQGINAENQMNLPLRIAQRQATAAGDFAKNEQLRFNNWTLKNTYDLQYRQLQAARQAQENAFISALLGLGGTVAGAATAGPAGALVGGSVASKL